MTTWSSWDFSIAPMMQWIYYQIEFATFLEIERSCTYSSFSSLSEFLKFYLTTNNYIWQHFPQMTLLWIPLEFFCYHVRHCNRSEGGKNCTKHALHVKGHLWSFNVRLKMSSEKKVQRPLCLLAAFFTKRKWLPGQRHSNRGCPSFS